MLAVGWVSIAIAAIVLVLVVDLAAYLVAFSRAQAAADAAALAAVVRTDPRGAASGSPVVAASRVAAANGADLLECGCPPGATVARVTVGIPVRAVAVTRFAARTVTATARAHLTPDVRAPNSPSSRESPRRRETVVGDGFLRGGGGEWVLGCRKRSCATVSCGAGRR